MSFNFASGSFFLLALALPGYAAVHPCNGAREQVNAGAFQVRREPKKLNRWRSGSGGMTIAAPLNLHSLADCDRRALY